MTLVSEANGERSLILLLVRWRKVMSVSAASGEMSHISFVQRLRCVSLVSPASGENVQGLQVEVVDYIVLRELERS